VSDRTGSGLEPEQCDAVAGAKQPAPRPARPADRGPRSGGLLWSATVGIALPVVCYALAVLLLGRWVMDDAGVSFAYARNLAGGHGLVSQPGRVPVEGFSNFLWVLVLVPAFLFHVFDPIVTTRVLAVALFAATVGIIHLTCAGARARPRRD